MIIRTELSLKIEQYDKRLLGYTASMSYTYAQLCVIADASSLLPVEITAGGELLHIEDVADIVLHKKEKHGDDITIDVYPKDVSYITAIMDGVRNYHPEFKQTIEDMRDEPGNEDSREEIEKNGSTDDSDEIEFKFIRLVMPDVDKDRRDLLMELVKGSREVLNVHFEAMKAKTQVQIGKASAGVSKEELDAVDKQIDSIHDYYVQMADKLTEDKKKQIEDAYQEHIKKHPEDAVNKAPAEKTAAEQANESGSGKGSEPNPESETKATHTLKMDW